MNVVLPTLKVGRYPRANYLKREIEHVRRYIRIAPLKRTELTNWLTAADAKLRADTGAAGATTAVVTNGQVLGPFGGSTFTFTVVNGVVTNIVKAP